MAAPREIAEAMEARVLETFRRDGIIPPELIRFVQSATTRRNGHIPTSDEVERYCREWMQAKLEAEAKKPAPIQHSDDRIERAVDMLMCHSPRSRPKEWAEALALVQQASREGRLTRAQTAELDALNAVYAAKVG